MEAPGAVGKFLFVTGYTLGRSALAIAQYGLGDDRSVARATRGWAVGVARGIGMEVRVVGAHRVGTARPCIFMSNHQSHVDIVALLVGLPVQPGFLAKSELRRIPFFGRAMELGGHVFIDRGNKRDAFAAIEQAAARVRTGNSIVVFPEGTRSDTETIKPLKKGGFHLARKARVPVVPVGLRGTARVLPKHSRVIQPGTVEVHIGEPIAPATIARLRPDALAVMVRAAISELAAMPLREVR